MNLYISLAVHENTALYNRRLLLDWKNTSCICCSAERNANKDPL